MGPAIIDVLNNEHRKTFLIDGNNFTDLRGFCDEIHEKLCPSIPFNGHFDAFNDILRGGFGPYGYDEPINLVWKYSAKSAKDLGYEATISHHKEWVKRVHPSGIEKVNQKLEDARHNNGETLFDIYVGIIREHHSHINFKLD